MHERSSTMFPGQAVQHGTGVTATRAFPTEQHPDSLDPFVLFERFDIEPGTGFPTHPHRGFEIVSYMLSGGMDHEDSMGVSHTARKGGAMRITTGAGMRHSELPADDAACNGLQLWVNLPREAKDAEPDYVDATAEELPTTETDGATVTTVVGEGSPISLHTEMTYLDVRVQDAWTWSVPAGWNGFLFGVSGDGSVDGDEFGKGDVFTVQDDGETLVETTERLRVAAVSGEPHGEPIQQRGPYVL